MSISEEAPIFATRLSYIQSIADELMSAPHFLPTVDQERLYEAALSSVVSVISSQACRFSDAAGSAKMQGDGKSTKKMAWCEHLKHLQRMEHARLYNPPSDSEILYYLQIRDFIQPLILYFHSKREVYGTQKLGFYSPFEQLLFMEKLANANTHFRDILAMLCSDSSLDCPFKLKPDMGVALMKLKQEEATATAAAASLISGSHEIRNNMFYHHKFNLAYQDLRSSLLAYSPPSCQEKHIYEQVLLHVPSSNLKPCSQSESEDWSWWCTCTVSDEVNVYSDQLLHLFLRKLNDDISSFDSYIERISQEILMKLSIPVESLKDLLLGYDEYDETVEEQDESVLNFQTELLEKCDVSYRDLPTYLEDLDRFIGITNYIIEFANELYDFNCVAVSHLTMAYHHYKESSHSSIVKNIGWEALHALTLMKKGSICLQNDYQERSVLQICSKRARLKLRDEEHSDGNIDILKGILEDFRVVDWDAEQLPTHEEWQVLIKIWQLTASAVHFFGCTVAYEQRTHIIQQGGNHPLLNARKGEYDDCVTLMQTHLGTYSTRSKILCVGTALKDYKHGLLRKLELNSP